MSQLYKKLPIELSETSWSSSTAADFHETTKYSAATAAKAGKTISDYLSNPITQLHSFYHFKDYSLFEHIELPAVVSQQVDLTQLMFSRRSHREFSQEPLTLLELANTLGQAAKVCRYYQLPEHPTTNFGLRPYPSGGGLYPCEIYLIACRVDGLATGVYNYQSNSHQLAKISVLPAMSDLRLALMDNPLIDSVAAVVVITAVFERSYIKYAERSYRLALLEAGHLAQNLILSCESQQIGSVAWGGFLDDKLTGIIGCHPIHEPVLHSVLIGKSAT